MKLITCSFVAFGAASAFAQSPLQVSSGPTTQSRCGSALAAIGDVDGDGRPDYAVGSPGEQIGGLPVGRVRIYSGASGALLRTLSSTTNDLDMFGDVLEPAGDVDADGVPDLLLRAFPFTLTQGQLPREIRIHSGATGALIRVHVESNNSNDDLLAVSVGDVNQDGHADVALSSYTINANTGRIWIRSGLDGALLRAIDGSPGERLGWTLGAAGDVDGDGFGDVIVGVLNDASPPGGHTARVYSGATGNLIHRFVAPTPIADNYGRSVNGAGDVDNDGYADLVVGATRGQNSLSPPGYARVYSGATGNLVWEFNGVEGGTSLNNDGFGLDVACAGDFDGDGHDDVIVGMPQRAGYVFDDGEARIYSGATGALLASIRGPWGTDARLGVNVAGIGDVDGNGLDDVIVGAPGENLGGVDRGTARVYGGGVVPPAGTSYCTAAINVTGNPALISAIGSTSISANSLWLQASITPGNTSGRFFFGSSSANTPFGNGFRCVAGQVHRLPAVVQNNTAYTMGFAFDQNYGPIANVITAGSTWYFQLWYRDGPGAFNLSDGCAITFQP